MEGLSRARPRVSTSFNTIEQTTDGKALKEMLGKQRIHSWPFLPCKRKANSARTSSSSSVSIVNTCSCLPRAHVTHQESCLSEKYTELSGSPDFLPEIENFTHATTSVHKDASLLLPSTPQALHCLHKEPISPKLASRSHGSSQILHGHQCLRHRAGSYDLERDYTLNEALALLPNEPCGSNDGFVVNSTTGRIIPSCVETLQESLPADTAVFDDDTIEYDRPQSRFYSLQPCQNTILQDSPIQRDSKAKQAPGNFMAKLVRPVSWFQSKIFKHPTRPGEEEKSAEIRQPFTPRKFLGSVADSYTLNPSPPLDEPPLLHAQASRLERNTRPATIRRLSITGSFGPTLAESIQEATLKPQSPSVVTLPPTIGSWQPFPSASKSSASNWPTIQTV